MQSQVYSQDDLKQLLHKVIRERSALVTKPKEPIREKIEPPAIVTELVEVEMAEEPKPLPALAEPPPVAMSSLEPVFELQGRVNVNLYSEELDTLKLQNEALQKELGLAKTSAPQVPARQEIEKYKEAIRKLTHNLQEAKEETEQAKSAIRKLSLSLQEANIPKSHEPEDTKARLLNLETAVGPRQKAQDFESESLVMGAEHSQTAKAAPITSDYGSKDCAFRPDPTAVSRLKLMSDKKELEDKVTALSCEKATLAAKLQNLQQKTLLGDQTQSSLNSQLVELAKALEESTEELDNTQNELSIARTLANSHERQNEKILNELESLQESHEAMRVRASLAENKVDELALLLESNQKSHAQELSVSQACVVERSQAFEEEQKKHRLLAEEHLFAKKRLEEQENHLRLLEQHLSRRVKECALLSKQIEDLMDRSSLLQNSLATSEQKCVALQHSHEQLQKHEAALKIDLERKTEAFQQELQELTSALEAKEQELLNLRQVQSQFLALEALFKKSTEIFTTKPEEAPSHGAVQKTQRDFFSQNSPQKPTKTSFFD